MPRLIPGHEKLMEIARKRNPHKRPATSEALVMRQLQHPHIVRVEEADYTEDTALLSKRWRIDLRTGKRGHRIEP